MFRRDLVVIKLVPGPSLQRAPSTLGEKRRWLSVHMGPKAAGNIGRYWGGGDPPAVYGHCNTSRWGGGFLPGGYCCATLICRVGGKRQAGIRMQQCISQLQSIHV